MVLRSMCDKLKTQVVDELVAAHFAAGPAASCRNKQEDVPKVANLMHGMLVWEHRCDCRTKCRPMCTLNGN